MPKMTDEQLEEAVGRFADEMRTLGVEVTDDEWAAKKAELKAQSEGRIALPSETGGEFTSFQEALEYGSDDLQILDDYVKLDDKAALVNQPFVINKWWFTDGDMGTFVVCKLITRDDQKFVLTDGSTGICDQLRRITMATGKRGPMLIRNGLRRSDYTAATDEGPKRATTFYLT